MKKTRTPVSLLLCTLLALLMLLMLLPLGTVSFAAGETPGDTVVTVVETGDCGAEGSDVQYTLYSDGTLVISGETKTIDKLPGTHEQSSNPIQRILDWVKSFFDSIGDLFRNLFRF